MKDKIVVKNYSGSEKIAAEIYKRDAKLMAQQNYYPVSQNWIPGSYGCGTFILALILSIVIVGVLIFVYLILVKPDGTLSVTYELKEQKEFDELNISSKIIDQKECLICAEFVKAKAKKCRFCGYEF